MPTSFSTTGIDACVFCTDYHLGWLDPSAPKPGEHLSETFLCVVEVEKVQLLVFRRINRRIQCVFGDVNSNELRKIHKFVVFSLADAILSLTQILLLDCNVYDSKWSSQYGGKRKPNTQCRRDV